jgi:hypothetical protein
MLILFTFLIVTKVFANDVQPFTLKGKWLVETNGKEMNHPQTSALKLWRGKLLSVSDRSALESQQQQLHIIDSSTGIVAKESLTIHLAENVKSSCFSKYLAGKPDFEALVVAPNNDSVFFVVTEDARLSTLSLSCQKRFDNTGSTVYPSLLVRLELIEKNILLMTDVRPIQFDTNFNIGNFPNDGIEGMAFGQNNTLYLGLEKDSKGNARIFSIPITNDFWQLTDFIQLSDTQVSLPKFVGGRHPINGMDYLPVKDHAGYLVAAARNDDQLWLIDLSNKKPTIVISMKFLAPVDTKNKQCGNSGWELIKHTSLEGIAIDNQTIWMINDPWTEYYLDNVICESNRDKYQRLSPLLFSLPISKILFE